MKTFAFTLLGPLLLYVGLAVRPGAGARPTRAVWVPAAATAHAVDTSTSADHNEVIQQYCQRCHNQRRLRGNLSLEAFDVDAVDANAEVAEKMVRKLRAGMMPPPGSRRPAEDGIWSKPVEKPNMTNPMDHATAYVIPVGEAITGLHQ